MQCVECKATLPDNRLVCPQCGMHNTVAGRVSQPQSTAHVPGDRQREYHAALLGEHNCDYYLYRFQRFARGDGSASWNWAAFFMNFYWLLYRKMWLAAIAYVVIPYAAILLVMMPVLQRGGQPPGTLLTFLPLGLSLLMLAYVVLFGVYANRLYYRHINNKRQQVQAYTGDHARRLQLMEEKGGTSMSAVAVALAVTLVLPIAVLLAVGIPAYQDYSIRTQVSDAILATSRDRLRIAEHSLLYDVWPDASDISLAPLNLHAPYAHYKLGDEGRIIITLSAPVVEPPGQVMLTPVYDEHGVSISWTCSATGIPSQWLPNLCR